MTNEWPPLAYVHTKGKVVSVHGMKAHVGAGTAPLILKIGTRREQYVASSTGPPVATKKSLGGPHSPYRRSEEEIIRPMHGESNYDSTKGPAHCLVNIPTPRSY
jgi:hypothetical protein